MSERFAFLLELRENMETPAQKAARGLRGVEQGLARASAELRKLEHQAMQSELDKLLYGKDADPFKAQQLSIRMGIHAMETHKRKLQETAAAARESKESWSQFAMGLEASISIIARVGDALMAVGRITFQAGSFAIATLGQKESDLASLKLMLGSEGAADAYYKKALEYGKKTPFATKDVMTTTKQLKAAGFNEKEAFIAFQGIGDVASSSGTGGEGMASLVRALGQIKGRGAMMTEELNQLMEVASSAGVSRQMLFERIAQMKGGGVKGTQVADLMSKGKVSADEGIFAFFDVVKKVSGGELGNQILAQGQTIQGLLSTLESAPGDFFSNMDFSNLPGLTTFKSVVTNLTSLLDTSSVAGGRLQASLEKAFNGIMQGLFGSLEGEAGMKKMESVIISVADALAAVDWVTFFQDAKTAISSVVMVIRGVGTVLGWVWEIFAGLGRFIGFVWGSVFTSLETGLNFFLANMERGMKVIGFLADGEFSKAGEAAADGLTNALWGGQNSVYSAAVGLGDATREGYKDVLKIRSPSQVMFEAAEYAVEGINRGYESGQPDVDAQAAQLAGALPSKFGSAGGAGGRRGGAGGGGIVIQSPLFTIQVTAEAGVDLNALAQKIAAMASSSVVDALESMAVEMGALPEGEPA